MFPLLLRRYKHLYHVGKSFSKISCKLSVLHNESEIASMDWKRSILWLDIGNAILVKTCYDDLWHKITETVLIKKKKTALKLVMQFKLHMIISTLSTTTCASECIGGVENAEVRTPMYGIEVRK